ncbi:MerR family transcriptional regulator [Limosilactobacillus caecicola]|uniref:MerR family transcriptional regulator n=1 Tax=Limosilactobacillus caecicola TaxID=2941332 RepID=UPI00203D13CE|nr:MerR family transcriptional regulator [Limosilactobacillus caecicola]
MNIKEVSKRLGIPKETLRYWEHNGLIPTVPRNQSGYRDYTEREIKWALFIKAMRKAGMSIESLIEFVRLYHTEHDNYSAQKALIQDQYDSLMAKRHELDKTLSYLKYKLDNFETHTIPFLEEESYYEQRKGKLMNDDGKDD